MVTNTPDIKFAILATDVVIFTVNERGLNVLLTYAKSGPFSGMPTLPGGLIKPKEKVRDAVSRFISQVLTTKENYREQLFTFGNPGRDPGGRVVSVTYLALISWRKAKKATKKGAFWKEVETLPHLGYDHGEVLEMAQERLSGKIAYTNIVYGLMPEEFTLTELQSTYEKILKKTLDKRNFRKKIHSLRMLKKLPKLRKNEAARPAQLYKFKSDKLEKVDVL
ncbi:NUDIX hydrolase [Candidatus Woesebacteria bacterium]|nr:NUDIX hydrolase [Candidatus Woesebacteria bacterium]